MNITDLPALLEKLQNHGRQAEAFETLLGEISTALADILSHLESAGQPQAEAMAGALAKALAGAMSAQPAAAAPKVEVNVQPTPVSVNIPEIKMPALQVIQGDGSDFKFAFEYDRLGRVESATATRVRK